MELKKFQKDIISDLVKYLQINDEVKDYKEAYNKFWNEKNIRVGHGGVPSYKDLIEGTPHLCVKVPTGGGKTFIAVNAIKPLTEKSQWGAENVVVWLVPSETILSQTLKNLKNPYHEYRKKLDVDFNSRVRVYDKEELLSGQNFDITSVKEQLSIFVLSYDTFRSKSKENRRIYRENSNLEQFTEQFKDTDSLIEGIDESALVQVINQLMPILIVDESHNAQSTLSIEMLRNLNPSFILDLTATPSQNSNVLSYVDAIKLKRESMIKLPLIVNNRKNQSDVIINAIDLRNSLEKQAIEDQKTTGRYIRPIVLFQAEPRNSGDSTTFEKVKQKLIESGIDSNQIAIKTSAINELKNIDLESPDCEIRYIITVNALKEGWDCPFAYILATLANRSSNIEVEQIVGRVLRLPYVISNPSQFLNMSYVFTSSNAFAETLYDIELGLNNAGFSKHDYRVIENIEPDEPEEENFVQGDIFERDESEEEALNFDPEEVKQGVDNQGKNEEILEQAAAINEEYNQNIEDADSKISFGEERSFMDVKEVNSQYTDIIESLKLPRFFTKISENIFGEDEVPVTREMLSSNFSLSKKRVPANLSQVTDEIGQFDISVNEGQGSVAKYHRFNARQIEQFKNYIASLPQEQKKRVVINSICSNLSSINAVSATDIKDYVVRIVDNMDADEVSYLENNSLTVAYRIRKFIYSLLDEERYNNFKAMVDSAQIYTNESYVFPKENNIPEGDSFIAKGLYQAESGKMNTYEHDLITRVSALDNIVWWHRVTENDKREFYINGFLNHYPDFIAHTTNGKTILIEVKGEQLANIESYRKAELGHIWESVSANTFRYFMVFKDKVTEKKPGVYTFDNFLNVLSKL